MTTEQKVRVLRQYVAKFDNMRIFSEKVGMKYDTVRHWACGCRPIKEATLELIKFRLIEKGYDLN